MYEVVLDNYKNKSIKAIDVICNRCLSDNIIEDSFGVKYCLDCFEFKEITSDKYLLRKERSIEKINHELKLDFALSKKQIQGSEFLVNCYKERKNAFLQAVCGAGKTEMCLSLISHVLNEFKIVGFVIPRIEIIKQVTQRMREYFPKTKISSLYGGEILNEESSFIILTPQQLIKFYQEFDLLIVDEVDAFPLANNPFFERLFLKSKKENAITIYMSATITKNHQKLIKNKELSYHLISKRYHYKELAIPKFIKKDNFLDISILPLIDEYVKKEVPLIIYVPSIEKGKNFLQVLINNNYDVELITSETKFTKSIIKDFIRKNIQILVSTTILERGVTFKDISVIVLEADSKVFNESSLIQIAGRVGRLDDEGEVLFLSKYQSKAMAEAKRKIIAFNNQL